VSADLGRAVKKRRGTGAATALADMSTADSAATPAAAGAAEVDLKTPASAMLCS
jgi:hypothetical protein